MASQLICICAALYPLTIASVVLPSRHVTDPFPVAQIMWMSTGMAPMMLPGAHQLMPPMSMGLNSACMPPAAQFLSQIQAVPPFLSNPLPNQIPQISPASTSAPNVTNQVQSNRMAQPRNPFLHPNDAFTSTPQGPNSLQLPSLFGYGPQMAQENAIQGLLACTAAPALDAEQLSSSDGTGTNTTTIQ